jgi:two-component system phosphate regulon sensor histidine kinase PhoR
MLRRDLLVLLPAVWLVVVAVLVAMGLRAAPTELVVVVLVAGALGSVLVFAHAASRRRRVARLNEVARRLISDGLAPRQPATGEDREGDDEVGLSGLRDNLALLGRRLAEESKDAAKKSRNLDALIDGLDEPVFATDNNDAVLLCNRAAESLLGSAPGRLLGRNVRELFTRPELLQMHSAARAGQTRRARVPLVSHEGVRTFQVSAAPLPAAWGEGVFGVVMVLRDVTELAQAVQVRTDFVANASHELRTPVAAIKVAAETLLDGAKDDPPMRERLIRMIADHTQRLEELVRDLMDLSRLETPDLPVHLAPIDLQETEVTLRTLFEPALRSRRLTLEFAIDPELTASIAGDGKLLLLILRNLVDNAAKYAFERTTIRVVAAPLPSAPTSAEPAPRPPTFADQVPHDAPSLWVRFEVRDQGVGIPLAQQERVFERFFQADAARTGGPPGARRGTGLGLAIVKHAARCMGGTVGLESVWQQGTTVFVDLPLRRLPAGTTTN